jgi:hypothetical protein
MGTCASCPPGAKACARTRRTHACVGKAKTCTSRTLSWRVSHRFPSRKPRSISCTPPPPRSSTCTPPRPPPPPPPRLRVRVVPPRVWGGGHGEGVGGRIWAAADLFPPPRICSRRRRRRRCRPEGPRRCGCGYTSLRTSRRWAPPASSCTGSGHSWGTRRTARRTPRRRCARTPCTGSRRRRRRRRR